MALPNVSLLSGGLNQAVVTISNRANPAVCIHGDSLITLASISYKNALLWMRNAGEPGFPDDMLDEVVYLSNRLVSLVYAYNDAIRCSGAGAKLLDVQGLELIDL